MRADATHGVHVNAKVKVFNGGLAGNGALLVTPRNSLPQCLLGNPVDALAFGLSRHGQLLMQFGRDSQIEFS
jgi:hypothetical protein